MEIIPDYNRDGKINEADRHRVCFSNRWRWWINDDNDDPKVERGENPMDVPKTPYKDKPDHRDFKVDGLRDLIDFFPLHLDLKEALKVLPSDKYDYFIRHEREALKFFEFSSVIPDANPDELAPNSYFKKVSVGRWASKQKLREVAIQGVVSKLSKGYLQDAKAGKGIVVIEGASKTSSPLVLEIKTKKGVSLAKLKFHLRIVDVESMYRQLNLRSFTDGEGGNPTKLTNPIGYPDKLTNGKYVGYIHGYNVTGESAKGSQPNIFKRLHQMGSKARYIGITWNGTPPNPGVNLALPPDYHRAVYNGLFTGALLKGQLGKEIANSDLTLLAHSLGNSVASNAIANHGLKVNKYYIINGAVPLEAYDAAQTSNSTNDRDMARNMTEDDWKPYYDQGQKGKRLLAANWHALFDAKDNRSKLTWKNVFAKPELFNVAYNFYSPGDEIVEHADETEEFGDWGNLWNAATQGRHAWVQQEIAKGGQNAFALTGFHELNGGWEFNRDWYVTAPDGNGGHYRRRRGFNETKIITDEQLKRKPFHRHLIYRDLYDPNRGSQRAGLLLSRYKLLATGIPAMTYAIATNASDPFKALNSPDGKERNFNMQADLKSADGKNTWPIKFKKRPKDWLHSDFKDVALHFVHPMYQKMIDLAKLDED